MSEAKNECEWLFPPGAEFTIERIYPKIIGKNIINIDEEKDVEDQLKF